MQALLLLSPALLGIWLPYLWPAFGQRVRRGPGPWLTNFPRRHVPLAATRDLLLSAGAAALFWLPLAPLLLLLACAAVLLALARLARWLDPQPSGEATVTLCVGADVPAQEIARALAQQGALLLPQRSQQLGRLDLPQGRVWVRYAPELLWQLDPEAQPDRAAELSPRWRQLAERLGGEPQTLILLFHDRRAGAQAEQMRAAMRLICALEQRWRCACFGPDQRVHSGAAICEQLKGQTVLWAEPPAATNR